jgi:hypothetical protein
MAEMQDFTSTWPGAVSGRSSGRSSTLRGAVKYRLSKSPDEEPIDDLIINSCPEYWKLLKFRIIASELC